MTELKPCPWCGYSDHEISGEDGVYHVVCLTCHAQGPAVCGDDDILSPGEAWNNLPRNHDVFALKNEIGELKNTCASWEARYEATRIRVKQLLEEMK